MPNAGLLTVLARGPSTPVLVPSRMEVPVPHPGFDGEGNAEGNDEGNDDDKILWHVRRSSIFAILSDHTKRQTLRRLRELILITPPTSPTYDRGVAHRNLADECHKLPGAGMRR